jgi:O-antigen/teichoic acid export membrane protein
VAAVRPVPSPALRARLLGLLRSPALLSALLFAAGGVGFAVGNILLARVLPPVEYGYVALFLALIQLAITLGPVGLETVIIRHHLGARAALMARAFGTSAIVGIGLAAASMILYGANPSLAAVLAVAALAASLNKVAGSFFQSRERYGLSLFLNQIHNWIVLLCVPVVMAFERPDALPAALTITAGYCVMGAIAWWRAVREHAHDAVPVPSQALMKEGLAAMGTQVAIGVFFQLDRLIIPRTLSIADLATYSVVSAIAASPFRMLQVGASFTLLPGLRASASRAAVFRLLRREAAAVLAMAIIAAVLVILVTPWIGTHLLNGQYPFTASLLYAMVIVGFVRVWAGFAYAAVSALGSTSQLSHYNWWSGVALAIAVVAAIAASGQGLTGIVYGLGAGWLFLAVAATFIASRALGAWRPSPAPR